MMAVLMLSMQPCSYTKDGKQSIWQVHKKLSLWLHEMGYMHGDGGRMHAAKQKH